MSAEAKRYTLSELADENGTPPRTIRYYIARNLLDGPDKAGRDAGYGEEHLARLAEIARLQKRGMTLAEIAHELATGTEAPVLTAQPTGLSSSWRHYAVAEDIVVMVRENAAPWRVRTIAKSINQLSQILAEQNSSQEAPK